MEFQSDWKIQLEPPPVGKTFGGPVLYHRKSTAC